MKHLALALTLSCGLSLASPAQDQNSVTKTGQTIEHGAQATGETIKHGTQATERTVGKGLKNAGNTLEKAGTETKKPRHHYKSKSAKAKSSPSPRPLKISQLTPRPQGGMPPTYDSMH
jgi:hypothetical protein